MAKMLQNQSGPDSFGCGGTSIWLTAFMEWFDANLEGVVLEYVWPSNGLLFAPMAEINILTPMNSSVLSTPSILAEKPFFTLCNIDRDGDRALKPS